MNVREASKALVSGTVVYIVMAACSAASDMRHVADDAGVPQGARDGSDHVNGETGGVPAHAEHDASGLNLDGALHVLREAGFRDAQAIREAAAQEAGSTNMLITKSCDVTAGSYRFAVLNVPGKAPSELARTLAFAKISDAAVVRPSGFDTMNMVTYFQGGQIAAWCVYGATEVTFVLP
jgi:hypothetical protein